MTQVRRPWWPPPLGLQGSFEATDEFGRVKGLLEETCRTTRKCPFFKTWLLARRDHDHRHRALGCRKVLLEFDATHARHLDVGNDACKALDCSASEELFGRSETTGLVASRPGQRDNSSPHGIIIVDDGDQGSRWHGVLSVDCPQCAASESTRPEPFAHARIAGNHTQVLLACSQADFGLSASAMRTKSASVRAPILRIAAPR